MKYRLDSARKNKTRLRRKFITTPAKKKPTRQRKRKTNWLGVILSGWCLVSIVGLAYLYTKEPKVEYRTTLLMEQPTIPLIPPLSSEPKIVIKEVKSKPKIIRKDTSNCYMARRDGQYFMDCNWK